MHRAAFNRVVMASGVRALAAWAAVVVLPQRCPAASVLESAPELEPPLQLRNTLLAGGIAIYGDYNANLYADLAGGVKRGSTANGRLDVNLDLDLDRIAGIPGAVIHANMFQIAGRDLSEDYVGTFLSVNDVAALNTSRLYELYWQQRVGDWLEVRAGQIGIDVEFLTSDYAEQFVNATFGWAAPVSENLPEGGPAYPLATPAVRVRINPVDGLSLLAGVFDGEPAGPGEGDPQLRDRDGLNFRTSDPPLVLFEAQVRYNEVEDDSDEQHPGGTQLGEHRGTRPDAAPAGLPGTLKLGAFVHFGRFADRRTADGDGDLAAGAGPASHARDFGVYGVFDQQLYRAPGSDPQRGIGMFLRLVGSPSDRNVIDFYADGGLAARGMVPGRPHDLFGIALTYAHIAPAGHTAAASRSGPNDFEDPVRGYEAAVEVTYRARVVTGIDLQPTFQYFLHPAGSTTAADGREATPVHDAVVFGGTVELHF